MHHKFGPFVIAAAARARRGRWAGDTLSREIRDVDGTTVCLWRKQTKAAEPVRDNQ